MNIEEVIRKRKSVRTFDGRSLSQEDRQKMEEALKHMENPFHIPLKCRLLDTEEHRLSSPVILGERLYAAGKYKKADMAEEAYGYAFEKFILKAEEIGVGTVWLAGTLDRKAFEAAMETDEEEVMPAAIPMGYAASRRSLRENMMRKGLKADERAAFSVNFFRQDFRSPLERTDAGIWEFPLEMVRLAPSATNKQPWRVVAAEEGCHFFEKRTKGYSREGLGDIQKVDMGIAMAHFELAAGDRDIHGEWKRQAPDIAVPENTEYIVSFLRK